MVCLLNEIGIGAAVDELELFSGGSSLGEGDFLVLGVVAAEGVEAGTEIPRRVRVDEGKLDPAADRRGEGFLKVGKADSLLGTGQ